MVRRIFQILALGVLLCCTTLQGGPPGSKTKPNGKAGDGPPNIEARFLNGSVVRMTLVPEAVEVQTEYGKLSIPPKEIRSIEFGWHIEPELEAKINEALGQLNSSSYKQREQAVNELIGIGAPAYPGLRETAKSKDMETAARAVKAMKEIEKKIPERLLNRRKDDVIRAKKFVIVGKVVNTTIQAKAEYFGELKLKPSQLQSIRPLGTVDESDVVIDAVAHGSSTETWLETNVEVAKGQGLKITATGQVDLWPQQPGGYLSGAAGRQSTRAPMTGPFAQFAATHAWNAGALVGRIGPNGTPFMIGDNFTGAAPASGRLHLNILMSPWNNASSGNYTVRISAGEELGE